MFITTGNYLSAEGKDMFKWDRKYIYEGVGVMSSRVPGGLI
jgi:hypothetical protein